MGGGRRSSASRKDKGEAQPGCMSGVFQMFDFPITNQPCFKPTVVQSHLQVESRVLLKGVKAPRNSFESEDEMFIGGGASSSSTTTTEIKEVDDFNLPMEIRVPSRAYLDEIFTVESPGVKTPSLVARLMGLDVLPENNSPSFHSHSPVVHQKRSKPNTGHRYHRECEDVRSRKHVQNRAQHLKCESGSRSLPGSPRVSSARRSDVDPSRLSLQINKENTMVLEEFERVRRKDWKPVDDYECRSPSNYARQIVKQVKESVSRRVGLLDITNNTSPKTTRTKSNNVDTQSLKPKKPRQSDESAAGYLSRLKILDSKTKSEEHITVSPRQITSKLRPVSKPAAQTQTAPSNNVVVQKAIPSKPKPPPLPQHLTIEKCKKASCERFTQRRESKENHFSDNKPKKKLSTLSNSIIEPTSAQIQIQSSRFQLEAQDSKPIRSQLSSVSRLTTQSQQQPTPNLIDQENRYRYSNSTDVEVFRYVTEILKRSGLKKEAMISCTRWYSPTHPLDPIIFHLMEHNSNQFSGTGSLNQRSYRKLVFQLVDEILADLLRPQINIKPWNQAFESNPMRSINGDQLLIKLWNQIKTYPALNCRTLADVDTLVGQDLMDANNRALPVFNESEAVVLEITQGILDSMVEDAIRFSYWNKG